MAWLWTYMGALYGTGRWNDHAPESVKPMWRDILGARTGVDIKRGIDACRRAGETWPPGAAEFNRRCAEFQPGTFAGAAAPPLPSRVELLENATVTGSARAYLDMCKRITPDGGLTRAELESLPPCVTVGGEIIRPRDYCTATDDPEFVKGKRQPHPESSA